MTRQAANVRWRGLLQVSALHDRSYIAVILLLAHVSTVKLSTCMCTHSSPARRIACACLCGNLKCNSLLTHAHPRMMQHLSSSIYTDTYNWNERVGTVTSLGI